MAPPLDTVLFDLDGTLIDSIELIRRSYVHTLEAHGLPQSDPAFWLAGLGRPLRWQFAQFTTDPAEIERMVATYRVHNRAHHDALVSAFPGAVEAVAELHSRGLRLGIVTSKMREGAYRGLRSCGFREEWFSAVVGADDVTEHKPHPEPVERALALLGSHASRAVMVGDSPHDLSSGRSAGTRTAAVAWGPFPHATLRATTPDHWLATPNDIATLA
ncbi:MAG: HAD-IA family hydrolase [Planctomycetota bacterium]